MSSRQNHRNETNADLLVLWNHATQPPVKSISEWIFQVEELFHWKLGIGKVPPFVDPAEILDLESRTGGLYLGTAQRTMVNKYSKVKVQVPHAKVTCKLDHNLLYYLISQQQKAVRTRYFGNLGEFFRIIPTSLLELFGGQMLPNLCYLIVNVNFRGPSDGKLVGVIELGAQVRWK
ncbi:hypothetical protein B0H14DRAFT_2581923 [Mycena olivaceomarginata]|nr:hypothetical protein B0H14DRAFT_2581923 [Mycena olivaceomarginata]